MSVALARHGETPFNAEGRFQGHLPVALTERGRAQAHALAEAAAQRTWAALWCSPLARARETAAIALPGITPVYDDDLVERDYGPTEGISSAELRRTDPSWDTWRTAVAGAETVDAVGARADRVIARVVGALEAPSPEPEPPSPDAPTAPRAERPPEPDERPGRRVLIVAHGHLLRILAARWIGQPAVVGSGLALDVGSVSVLGYEHDRRVIERWNVRD